MTLHDHSDLRSAEILSRVRQAFAEKGFDGASMQDLARAAGMSVGNFYRYFPSKSAIVGALVRHDMDDFDGMFAQIESAPDPLAALRARLAQHLEEGCGSQDAQLWAEITAASLRKPDLAQITQAMEQAVISHLLAIFARKAQIPVEQARGQFVAHARQILLLVKSCITQGGLSPTERTDLNALVLRNIDHTLDEINRPTCAKG